MTPAELRSVKGIGQATAVSISAAFELARRAERESISSPFINSPEDIYNALKTDVAHLNHEEFWALHISSSGRLLSRQKVSQGGLSSASVDQRMIFRQCYALGSSSIALVSQPSFRLVGCFRQRRGDNTRFRKVMPDTRFQPYGSRDNSKRRLRKPAPARHSIKGA